MQFYQHVVTLERDGYEIIVDKTWEETHPADLFDDSVCDLSEIIEGIDSGLYEWFRLRARVLVQGEEVGQAHLGGLLYAMPRDIFRDGTLDNLVIDALDSTVVF